jgi:hypothetical protein
MRKWNDKIHGFSRAFCGYFVQKSISIHLSTQKKAFFPQSATKNQPKKQLTNYKKGELLLTNDNKQYLSAHEI